MKTEVIKPELIIVDYVENHTKKESLLFNNRLFNMYCKPTEKHKLEYEANRNFIISFYKN